MKISSLLLNPDIAKLKAEFESLDREMSRQPGDHAVKLHSSIHQGIAGLEHLSREIMGLDQQPRGLFASQVYDEVKKYKLELRFARRKWLRFQSTENRLKKARENRQDVSTAAA